MPSSSNVFIKTHIQRVHLYYSRMSSKSNPSQVPTHPAPQEPLFRPSTPYANLSDQTLKRGRSTTSKSSPDSKRHAKKFSIGRASVTSRRSNDSTESKTVWDKDDTFLPRAKPPPPLPTLDPHKRAKSQHQIQSPSVRSWDTTGPSLDDLPVLDISRTHQADSAPRVRRLTRPSTAVTAGSSGTSDESISNQWRPPPSWAGPHACAGDEAKAPKPVRSLSRLGSRRRAQSNTRGGRDAALIKPNAPESEVIRIVGSGKQAGVYDRARIGKRPSTGVKIQCYEGWDEKPVKDVVHMLRELRLK